MKKCQKLYSIMLIAVAVVVAAVFGVMFFQNDNLGEDKKIVEKSKGKKKIRKSPRAKRNFIRGKRRVGDPIDAVEITSSATLKNKGRALSKMDDDEEAALTEEYRKLLADIRKALDSENRRSIRKILSKIQSNPNWLASTPSVIKRELLDAMGWFGASCLPEVVGFLADEDADVAQLAIEKYEEALSDIGLSDRERAKILVLASQLITDSDVMDSMLFELNNMRHSVAVDTIKQLMASGGAATQTVLPDNIEFYTGEEGMNTPEKLDQWLKDNPDDEWDEEFYGGSTEQQK